jgi:hypothetical protein
MKPEPQEETYAVRESRPLYHIRNGSHWELNPQPQEVTGTDVNLEHRSYHCATRTDSGATDITDYSYIMGYTPLAVVSRTCKTTHINHCYR